MASPTVINPGQGSQAFNPGGFQPRHQYVPRQHSDTSPGHGTFFRPRHKFQPRFPPNSGNVDDASVSYDGKRMRKAIHRKTVDYNPSVFKYLQNRIWQRDRRDEHQVQPDSLYSSELVPPSALIQKPMNCVTTKFVRTSTNKFRCPVFCLSWTPEGRRLVTGASSGEFTLWNGLTFNFETILQAHETSVRAMQWSHSDLWMITADHAGYIKYWQSNMNNVKMYQAHKEPIRGISFCPSDSKFATCSDDGTVRVWDFMRCHEERVLRGHGADVRCVDWHPQKGLIASGSKDNQQPIKLWDPRSGNSLATIHAHKHTVMDLKWHQNGSWMLTASRDHLVKLFDLRKMKEEMQTFKGHKREATAIAWHPIHESLFASGSADGALMFWMVGCDHEVGGMEEAHEGMIWDLAWHPLGHILASGSNDHTTKFWTRNRPGDDMRDKYNLNSLPQGVMEIETLEQVSGETSAMPNLPGMGLEHGLPEHLIKAEDKKKEGDSLPCIPGLDWEADEAFLKAEERAAQKKVPYSRPVPKVFEQAWSGEIDVEAVKKEQEKDQIQKQVHAQLEMKKNQPNPNLLLAAKQMLGALAGTIRQHLSTSEAARMLISGPPIMMRPQGPGVILAPGQSMVRQPQNRMLFVPGGAGAENQNMMSDGFPGGPNNGEMSGEGNIMSSDPSLQGNDGEMRPIGSQNLMGHQMGPQNGLPNQMGSQGGPNQRAVPNQMGQQQHPNQIRSQGGHPSQMGPRGINMNQMGPLGVPSNQMGPQGGQLNQMGPRGGQPNQMGPHGGQLNQMGPRSGQPNQMGPRGSQPNQMGPQGAQLNQMGPRGVQPNQMGLQGGQPNQMGLQGGQPNQMGPRGVQPNQTGPQGGQPNQRGLMMGPHGDQPQGGPRMGGFQSSPNVMGQRGQQNQMLGPQNPMVVPQQGGGSRNRMGGPSNQTFDAQGQFQNQMGGHPKQIGTAQNAHQGPQGEISGQQLQQGFGHSGQNQFGGPQRHGNDQWSQGRPDMREGQGPEGNAAIHTAGPSSNMLDGRTGMDMDEDFRGRGRYGQGQLPISGENPGSVEDQDYRNMSGRQDQDGAGRYAGLPQQRRQQGGNPNSDNYQQQRPDGRAYGGSYEEDYDSRYQDGGRGGGHRGGASSRGRGSWGHGGQQYGENEGGYEEQQYDEEEGGNDEGGIHGSYNDPTETASGRKRHWEEGPGAGSGGYRGRGRGGAGGRGRGRGDKRGGRGSSYRGNRGTGRGNRGTGRGNNRGWEQGSDRGGGRGRGGY